MELKDGGLLLRPIAPTDAGTIVAGLNDPEVVRFMPAIPTSYTPDDARRWVDRCEEVWRRGTSFPFAITDSDAGALLGSIEVTGAGTVGYWIAAHARGRGLATAALTLVCGWRNERPLRLTSHPDNLASQRVAEKAGFRRVGTIHDHPSFRDGTTPAVLFELV